MRTCVEGLCAVPMEAGLYHVLTFVKARVLMDQNIYLKVTSGGWSMRKDSVTTARKRLERCVCVFVIGIFFWFIIISVTWDHKYNCPIGLSVINQNVNIWMLQVVDGPWPEWCFGCDVNRMLFCYRSFLRRPGQSVSNIHRSRVLTWAPPLLCQPQVGWSRVGVLDYFSTSWRICQHWWIQTTDLKPVWSSLIIQAANASLLMLIFLSLNTDVYHWWEMLGLVVPQTTALYNVLVPDLLICCISIVVELVRAADIKVIAALGDSLTVSVIIYSFLFWFSSFLMDTVH